MNNVFGLQIGKNLENLFHDVCYVVFRNFFPPFFRESSQIQHIEKFEDKNQLILILEGFQDLHNVRVIKLAHNIHFRKKNIPFNCPYLFLFP